jgi:hypothetical protein
MADYKALYEAQLKENKKLFTKIREDELENEREGRNLWEQYNKFKQIVDNQKAQDRKLEIKNKKLKDENKKLRDVNKKLYETLKEENEQLKEENKKLTEENNELEEDEDGFAVSDWFHEHLDKHIKFHLTELGGEYNYIDTETGEHIFLLGKGGTLDEVRDYVEELKEENKQLKRVVDNETAHNRMLEKKNKKLKEENKELKEENKFLLNSKNELWKETEVYLSR